MRPQTGPPSYCPSRHSHVLSNAIQHAIAASVGIVVALCGLQACGCPDEQPRYSIVSGEYGTDGQFAATVDDKKVVIRYADATDQRIEVVYDVLNVHYEMRPGVY